MIDWQKLIVAEAAKLIARFESYARQLSDEGARRQRRTIFTEPKLELRRPAYWPLARGFDPYVVRANAHRISHSIADRIHRNAYEPRNPALHHVPKASGGLREICVFQIADSAVSREIFKSLMRKNKNKLSSRAYAYRDDIGVHDAVQYLAAELRDKRRVFIAEYDFSNYFDSISHDHIRRTLRDKRFLLTAREEKIIDGFLRVGTPRPKEAYTETGGPERVTGIPQGTSISLFLANVAAWELDRSLESLGVSFARYADDTLIWSADYAQVCKAVDVLYNLAERIGAGVNLKKSGGVRLLVPEGAPAEFSSTTSIDYLGHRFHLDRVGIKQSLIVKIKKRIQKLIYFNLLRAPKLNEQHRSRLGRVDRDYTAYIWQLRRYMYGNVSERTIRRFRLRGVPPQRFRGVMSYFPFVDAGDELEALDRWLVATTFLAMKRRAQLLLAAGFTSLPSPHGLPCPQLASYKRTSATTGGELDLRIPSFKKMQEIVSRGARVHGANRVARGPDYAYD